jgi:glycosyltransferase involved in cell wall biosynthesis/GT2 family glycosyltransferase
MDFTVVVNTLDRHETISQCLWSLQRQEQVTYEVVVVDGSAGDASEAIVNRDFPEMRYVRIADRNLSISRNVGIAAARGDLVAFIDDDAFAHPAWLATLLRRFDDPRVGAVGGFTRAAKADGWQVRATLCDRWGEAFPTEIASLDDFCFPGSPLYPSLLGTNSSFRQSALVDIGGFDPAFAYFLDETDVCLRLVDAGYLVRYEANAVVFHEMHRSGLRSPKHYPRSLRIPARSKAYFMHKHGLHLFGSQATSAKLVEYIDQILAHNDWFVSEGILSPGDGTRLNADVRDGVQEGVALSADARHIARGLTDSPVDGSLTSSAGFGTVSVPPNSRIALVCRRIPPTSVGGIAQWYWELSCEMAAQGHEVHLFTEAGDRRGTQIVRPGLWVHHVSIEAFDLLTAEARMLIDGPEDQVRWTFAAAMAVRGSGFQIDAALAPIWDAEGLGMQLLGDWPSCITLHTTHSLARRWKPDWARPAYSLAHVVRMEELEILSLTMADSVLSNSQFALDAVGDTCPAIRDGRTVTIPHGIKVETIAPDDDKWRGWGSRPVRVLFLGRAEKRKGFPEAAGAAVNLAARGGFILDFVGEGPTDEESVSASKSLRSQASQAITIHGRLGDRSVRDAIAASDVVLMPSRFESFGLVAAEAIEAGCLVIVPRESAMFETFGTFPSVVAINEVSAVAIEEALLELPRLVRDPGSAVRDARLRLQEEFEIGIITRQILEHLGTLESKR